MECSHFKNNKKIHHIQFFTQLLKNVNHGINFKWEGAN
jgi:hypothetical protein